jgi:NAD(P)-dependent dehydrogenase (short-subunit alcohol dehydrogenase family)
MSTPPTTSLAGRTAVVTGSTSGIGAATAHHLAARGARVVVTGRDAARGAEVVDAIAASGGSGVFVAGDLTAPPAVLRELAAAWTSALDGRIDVLVHNAAVCPAVDTVSLSDEDLETTLAVNLRAPQVLTAAIAPAMVAHGGGTIVVIGSWMAGVGHPFVGFYSATKAAEAQLARSWAAEFGPRGVRVNTVAPGATRTPINAEDGDIITRMTSTTPAGRPGTPDEVAAAITWLVSDEAAYVHGAVIPVDGGITATRPV